MSPGSTPLAKLENLIDRIIKSMKLENLFHIEVVKLLYAVANRILRITNPQVVEEDVPAITRNYLIMQYVLAKVAELSPELVQYTPERTYAHVVSTSADQQAFNTRCDKLTQEAKLTEVSAQSNNSGELEQQRSTRIAAHLVSVVLCCSVCL
jgi:NACalpha-BTF3-like transcription factor